MLCALLIQPFLAGYLTVCVKKKNPRAAAGAALTMLIALASPFALFYFV